MHQRPCFPEFTALCWVRSIFRSFYRMYHHVCILGTYLEDRTPLWDMSHRTISHIQVWPLWGYTHLHRWFLWEDLEAWVGLTVRRGREERASVSGDWAVLAVNLCHLDHRDIEIREGYPLLSSRERFPVSNPDPFTPLGRTTTPNPTPWWLWRKLIIRFSNSCNKVNSAEHSLQILMFITDVNFSCVV